MSAPGKPASRGRRSADLARHVPLVRKVAGRLCRHLPANVEMDDLMQAGSIGLDDALRRYEQGPGSTFETYAARRIEGAILDSLRAQDTLSRGARSRLRKARAAVQRLEHALGRAPRAKEVANELGWSLAEFHSCMVEAGMQGMREGDKNLEHEEEEHPAATDERYDVGERVDPLRALQQRQRHAVLSAAFDALEEADRYVMELIYDRDLTLQEVADTIGVSESRVSQIRSTVIAKLKSRLQEW